MIYDSRPIGSSDPDRRPKRRLPLHPPVHPRLLSRIGKRAPTPKRRQPPSPAEQRNPRCSKVSCVGHVQNPFQEADPVARRFRFGGIKTCCHTLGCAMFAAIRGPE